ncbi:hypothetical protein O0I10_010772 [Lichtheimia ornata]|uniref:Kinesin motor domain-containing protein n=1 Tax=Lichtheimia ornata TaxID=688661 RepID=A0AAD7UUC5_9FUNG|nr:uncharacterized protein O0I10_010772 [Lichtheimia ornata]KAJ8653622.1 hypothetical protein O0I10_010772 [Lichtheimia ornata]
MAVSKIRTVACLHPSSRPSLSSPHIQINTFASESFITIDNPPDITAFGQIRQRYNFSRCVTQPEQCKPEVEDLVQKALEGYNSAAVFMSTGPLDPFTSRQTILHQLLSYLDEQLNYVNESRKRDGKRSIQLDYAFLGFGDNNNCYDLRADRKLKKQYIGEHGLDTIMRRVNNANDIWKNTKEGSRVPFVLRLRLSDDRHFLGTLTIIDLLFPWRQPSAVGDQHYAFQDLVQVLNDYADLEFEGSISNSTNHLLTKITAECFCGPCKTAVFAYINEYPDNVVRDTIDTLELMQTVRRIRTVAIRNTVDNRMIDVYKQQLNTLQRKYESEHIRASNLETELNNAVQQLNVKDMDLHRVEVDEARARHESDETRKMMENQLEKMGRRLELERLKAVYEESKHVTKAIELDGKIIRLRSTLFCASAASVKHQEDLQNAYARIQKDEQIMQEQLSVIHQQDTTIQDMKDAKTAADEEKERLTQVVESLNDEIEKRQNELDNKKAVLDKKMNTIRRQKEALQQARQRLDDQDELLELKQSAIKSKDDHVTRLRELLERKQKQQRKSEKKAVDGKTLEDLEMLVESLKGDLAEAEDGKKALEKVIHEAKERAKSQEKTLRAQERTLTKAEKQQADYKHAQEAVKQLEGEKRRFMTEISRFTRTSSLMEDRIRQLERENYNLVNGLSKGSGEQEARNKEEEQPQPQQQQQHGNNDAHIVDDTFEEHAVESPSATNKPVARSLSRKLKQMKQQGNSSKATNKKGTPRREQQTSSSPEPILLSEADQSPILEYLGSDFEPVLRLPNVGVGENGDDDTPLVDRSVTEEMKNVEDHRDNNQSNTMDTQQHEGPNTRQKNRRDDNQPRVVSASQDATLDTQQSDGPNTQQTNQQDDIQSSAVVPSQDDTVDTQQSISLENSQPEYPQQRQRRQTRKRRRLADLKKREVEDYEGDLSPLSKVQRLINDNDKK